MSIIPKGISQLIYRLNKLPGIGPKTARRLAFFMFNMDKDELNGLIESLKNLKKDVKRCSFCGVLSDTDPCSICADLSRDNTKICIVEDSLDLFSLEKSGVYNGLYYVLNIKLDNDSLPKIDIRRLKKRVKDILQNRQTVEIIFALSTTIEGQTASLYIKQELQQWIKNFKNKSLKFSKMAIGLSVGASIDYVDSYTLKEAFEGRREF